MRLSQFLTDDEWDALFYLAHGPLGDPEGNLGTSMDNGIRALLEAGYEFAALTAEGKPNPSAQVLTGRPDAGIPSMNAHKLRMFSGNPHHLNPLDYIKGGRTFVKVVAPALLHDTDEEFAKALELVEEQLERMRQQELKIERRFRLGLLPLAIPEGITAAVGQGIYRAGQFVGIIQEVDEQTVWAKLDSAAWEQAGDGELVFGLERAQ